MVRIWPVCMPLRRSIMAASVVLLPDPVAPTTRISPRFQNQVAQHGRQIQVGQPGTCWLMKRMTTA